MNLGGRARRRPQRRQTGRRQCTEHPVRKLRQIRLEFDRVRAVRDRLPEQSLQLRAGRRRRLLLRRGDGRRRSRRGHRRRAGRGLFPLAERRLPRHRRRPQRRHRRSVQITRRTRTPRRLPAPNRRSRTRTEHPVRATRVEAPGLQPLLNLAPRRPVETQTFLYHRTVAAPNPHRAPGPAPGTALRQRRTPRPLRRAVGLPPAHRRAVGVLVSRVGRTPLERQNHRAARAALPQGPRPGGRRRLVVHCPAVLVALTLVYRQRAHRRLRRGRHRQTPKDAKNETRPLGYLHRVLPFHDFAKPIVAWVHPPLR